MYLVRPGARRGHFGFGDSGGTFDRSGASEPRSDQGRWVRKVRYLAVYSRHSMPPAVAALAIGIVGGLLLAGCMIAWDAAPPRPGSLQEVLFAQGAVLKVPGLGFLNFTVPKQGGIVLGTIQWDHSSVFAGVVAEGFYHCPVFLKYAGAPWTQQFNDTLGGGAHEFGAPCGGFGNGTVVQPIEVVYP